MNLFFQSIVCFVAFSQLICCTTNQLQPTKLDSLVNECIKVEKEQIAHFLKMKAKYNLFKGGIDPSSITATKFKRDVAPIMEEEAMVLNTKEIAGHYGVKLARKMQSMGYSTKQAEVIFLSLARTHGLQEWLDRACSVYGNIFRDALHEAARQSGKPTSPLVLAKMSYQLNSVSTNKQ